MKGWVKFTMVSGRRVKFVTKQNINHWIVESRIADLDRNGRWRLSEVVFV